MLDFHEKRKLKTILYSWPTIGVVAFLIFALSFSVYERYTTERTMWERKEALEEELEGLRVRANALEAQVDYLKSERGMEEEIRDRFQVSKKGEEIVVLVEDDVKKDVLVHEVATTTEENSFFDFLPW